MVIPHASAVTLLLQQVEKELRYAYNQVVQKAILFTFLSVVIFIITAALTKISVTLKVVAYLFYEAHFRHLPLGPGNNLYRWVGK